MELHEILERDELFRYQILGRMKMDCETFLATNGSSRLWGITVQEHIKYMKAIWKSFPADDKPDWLKYGRIVSYENAMKKLM